MRKKIVIAVALVCVLAAGIIFGISSWKKSRETTPDEMIARLESALGDEFKKQTMTEVVGTIQYADQEGNEINYHILKTTYYEADPAEVVGLNVNALGVLFDPEYAESCEKMMIQDWDAALYVLPERSYLCWTCTPEVSYVLEYNPSAIADEEIIKMAESVKPVDETE